MNANMILNYTPIYIYIMASIQLFIGFFIAFSLGQILTLRIREITYYFFSFFLLIIPFVYVIVTGKIYSGTRTLLFYIAILLAEFLCTRETFTKKISLFFILIFFNGVLEVFFCSVYWKLICNKLLGFRYIPYIHVPDQRLSTIIIFFAPVTFAEIAFNFYFPLLWKRYIRFINLHTFVEIILLPVLCTNGILFFFLESFGKAGWILIFFTLFIASIFFIHAVVQIPDVLKQIHLAKVQKQLLEKQIREYYEYQEQNHLLHRQNHDINNHLQALSFLLAQNHIEEMQKYIKELLKE